MGDDDPKRVAYPIWGAQRALSLAGTDVHDLDGDYPEIAADDVRKRLENARTDIEHALDAVDRVEAVQVLATPKLVEDRIQQGARTADILANGGDDQ